ncbi:MAG: HIT-like domain-containing protein [Linnemannia gamsii]|nr:MAG: HIT-like domain-containing protein [Linnemannia gamsii]
MTIIDRIFCRPCIFCAIAEGSTPTTLIYKDDEIAAFNDISPAAETHILIVPVDHVKSVKTVTTDHISLLEKMRLKGIDLLKERGHDPEDSRLGFHVPPFNTVDHLHLHVVGGAMKSNYRKLKYETGRMWYMDLTQLQANLDKKRRLHEGARL